MDNLSSQRTEPVAGFEANGGFLLGSGVSGLTALPTRDALLPMLSLLSQSAKEQRSIQALVAELPQRHVYSDRLEAYPAELSRALLARLLSDPDGQARLIGKPAPPIDINTTDGLRLSFTDGDIVHLRASGNAPELRCYAEADSLEQAKALCAAVLAGARSAP
jgi:phosphomannomutase